ncbi:MAG: hypothetical protein PWP65_1718 [Clostridia bacterium]|nr:hypothetical protein [Clostridia bacterium]
MLAIPACPLCGGRSVGRVGVAQYYCWDCFVEFDSQNRVYEVSEDGSLIAYKG